LDWDEEEAHAAVVVLKILGYHLQMQTLFINVIVIGIGSFIHFFYIKKNIKLCASIVRLILI